MDVTRVGRKEGAEKEEDLTGAVGRSMAVRRKRWQLVFDVFLNGRKEEQRIERGIEDEQ